MTASERHARLADQFTRAIELDAAARAALVAELRASDPGLAAELVELLAIDAGPGTALDTGALAPTPDTVAATRAARARAERPFELPGYRITGVLGRGGMGTVHDAEQIATRRPVAIKVLGAGSLAAFHRFAAEAEILGRLDHPGIAHIHAAGEIDGQPYFVMERVDGLRLDVHARDRQLGLPERLTLLAAICDAVHHAHVKGVIHRDLKPANLMVRGDGRVVVLDFGIARVAGAADRHDSARTHAGELIGTPLYMSPEQARLRPDEVDARSDVYTLGVIAYELITGRLPYDVIDRPLAEIARAICEQPPRPLDRGRPELRGDVAAILERALAKDPADRYQSASALADDLRAHLDHRSIAARQPGSLELLRRLARRRPAVVATVAALAVVTLASALIVTWLWLDARRAHRAADRSRQRAEDARAELEARANRLALRNARSAIDRDPTEAIGWLRSLTAHGSSAEEAWMIAEAARSRGVAIDLLVGHDDEVRWVEATADPRWLVTGGRDGRAMVWDRELRIVTAIDLGGEVGMVRPSPDGARILIGGSDGRLVMIDRDGRGRVDLAGHRGDLEAAAWSPDGDWLITGDDDGVVRMWQADGTPRATWTAPTATIEALEVSADGTVVVAGDESGAIWRWEVATGAAATEVGHVGGVVAVWADRSEVASVGADGTVRRWRVDGAKLVTDNWLGTGAEDTKIARFDADAGLAILGTAGGSVIRADLVARTIDQLGRHDGRIRAIAISADGRQVASGGEDGLVQCWDLPGDRLRLLRGHSRRVRELAFSADGALLLSSSADATVRVWPRSAAGGAIDGTGAAVERLAVSADGVMLAIADADGAVRLWSPARDQVAVIGRHARRATDVGFVAGGRVVSGGHDGVVAIWGPDGEGARFDLGSPVRRIAVSPDGRRIAAATLAGPIWLIDVGGAVLGQVEGHAKGAHVLRFSPDGAVLASGGEDYAVRLWRVGDGAPRSLGVAGQFDDDVRHVLFSPDGAQLAAASDDGRVTVWAIDASGAVGAAREIGRHGGAIAAAALLPGPRLVTIGLDRDAQVVGLDGTGQHRLRLRTSGAIAVMPVGDARPDVVDVIASTGELERWDLGSGDDTVLPVRAGATAAIALTGGGVAIGHADGAVRIHRPGPRRFTELAAALAPISTAVLIGDRVGAPWTQR